MATMLCAVVNQMSHTKFERPLTRQLDLERLVRGSNAAA